MNFADIENTWRSPHNRPSPAEMEKQKMQFITDLRRSRRAARGLLWITFVLLVFTTAKLVLHILWPDPELAKVDLSREWGVLPFFALPWIGWLFLLGQYVTGGRRHAHHESSVQASVAALVDENRMQRNFYKLVGALLLLSVMGLPFIVHQLRAVGKMGDGVTIPAFVIYPAYVAGLLIWFVYHYRRKLLPRKRELEALMSSYR